MNSPITSAVSYEMPSTMFGQWTDPMGDTFGINFASEKEAQSFKGAMAEALNYLRTPRMTRYPF